MDKVVSFLLTFGLLTFISRGPVTLDKHSPGLINLDSLYETKDSSNIEIVKRELRKELLQALDIPWWQTDTINLLPSFADSVVAARQRKEPGASFLSTPVQLRIYDAKGVKQSHAANCFVSAASGDTSLRATQVKTWFVSQAFDTLYQSAKARRLFSIIGYPQYFSLEVSNWSKGYKPPRNGEKRIIVIYWSTAFPNWSRAVLKAATGYMSLERDKRESMYFVCMDNLWGKRFQFPK